jgi:hypothetical protein
MELLLIVLTGIVAWSIAVNAGVITLLGQQALAQGTVRGYWGAFFEHCVEGNYSALGSLVVAAPVFACLVVAVPLAAWSRRRHVRAAIGILREHLERGRSIAESTTNARILLMDRGIGRERADAILDEYLENAAGNASRTSKSHSFFAVMTRHS